MLCMRAAFKCSQTSSARTLLAGEPPTFFYFFIFFNSTIYNAVLDRSLRACNTNSTYSKTTLRIACYYIPGPRSLLLAGDYRHKACSLFQDNVTLSSGECRREPSGCGNHHVYSQIALRKVP
jgi:hypothetical protein